MKMDIGTQIIATLFANGIVATIVWFFIKRYINNQDERLTAAEEKADHLQSNYTQKFEKVYQKMDENRDHLATKMEEIKVDKIEYRMKQIEQMTELKHQVKDIAGAVRRIEQNGKPTQY